MEETVTPEVNLQSPVVDLQQFLHCEAELEQSLDELLQAQQVIVNLCQQRVQIRVARYNRAKQSLRPVLTPNGKDQ